MNTDSGWAAGLVWSLARALVHVFYRVERVGGDVPDGPVLLVANHSNGLLDPAVVVAASRRRPCFLAKSTLFTMPVVGWFVRAAGSIPVYRRADVGADTGRNEEMFRAVQEALAAGAAVCLFPEGISHSSGRLEPLKTGAARIVLAAAAGTPVQVVPVGLNFEEKEAFRSTVLIGFGAPVPYDAWRELYASDPAAAVRGLTDEIARHLRDVMIEAAPRSDGVLVEDVERLYAAARGLERTPSGTLERRRAIAAGVIALRERDPDRFAALHDTLRQYERRRERFRLTDDALGISASGSAVATWTIREIAWAAVLWPVVALGVAVFFVPYQVVRLAARTAGATPDQQATIKIAAGLVVHLAWWLALCATGYAVGGRVLAIAALVGAPLLALATLFAEEREASVLEVVRGYVAARTLRETTRNRLVEQRAALVALLDETYEWLRTGASPPTRPPASDAPAGG